MKRSKGHVRVGLAFVAVSVLVAVMLYVVLKLKLTGGRQEDNVAIADNAMIENYSESEPIPADDRGAEEARYDYPPPPYRSDEANEIIVNEVVPEVAGDTAAQSDAGSSAGEN